MISWVEKFKAYDKRKKLIGGLLAGLVLCSIGGVGYAVYHSLHHETVVWSNTTVEYGTKDFQPVKSVDGTLISVSEVDTMTIGDVLVEAEVEKDGKTKTFREIFSVVDTQKPVIKVDQDHLEVVLHQNLDLEKLHIEANDPVDGKCSYGIKDFDSSKLGSQEVTIEAIDRNGNTSKKKIDVDVIGGHSSDQMKEYRDKIASLTKDYEKKLKEILEQEEKEQEEKEIKALIESLGMQHLSDNTKKWALKVHEFNQELWDTQYDAIVLAVIQTESNGQACDLMQSSESHGAGAPGMTCGVYKDEEEALRGGIKALKNAFNTAGVKNSKDYETIAYALQGYNYGPQWFEDYDSYSLKKAEEFSDKMKKKLKTDVYGVPGYPTYVFKYYDPSYTFVEDKEESSEQPEKEEKPNDSEQKPTEEKPNEEQPSEEEEDSSFSEERKKMYALLAKIDKLNASDYTEDSWKSLQNVVNSIDLKDPVQSLKLLQEAFDGLEKRS